MGSNQLAIKNMLIAIREVQKMLEGMLPCYQDQAYNQL
jgi:hypothetical protein